MMFWRTYDKGFSDGRKFERQRCTAIIEAEVLEADMTEEEMKSLLCASIIQVALATVEATKASIARKIRDENIP